MATEEFPKKELETLWAPWRIEYFAKEPRDLNFLSEAAQASDDAAHLVITRRKNAFLMMNRYPYAVGHLMAVPYRKVAELSALGDNEVVELWNLVVYAQALLRYATKAQGFNIGMNIGECAGAGVPDHLHIHIVPRWSGDTNFMPIIAGMYWGFQQHSAIVHGIYWLAKTHSIAEAPAPVPEFNASENQIQSVRERWEDFEQKTRAGQPAEIELTVDDINILIVTNRDI